MTLLPSLSLARAWVTAAAGGLVLIFTTPATLTLQVARADAAGCTITGTSGKDKLVGTKKADVIWRALMTRMRATQNRMRGRSPTATELTGE